MITDQLVRDVIDGWAGNRSVSCGRHRRLCHPCRVNPGAGPLRVVAGKSHMGGQAGSSLKICRIADGGADIYPRLGSACEWDAAAAQAVLEAAGGAVLSLSGQPLGCGSHPAVLAPPESALGDGAQLLLPSAVPS